MLITTVACIVACLLACTTPVRMRDNVGFFPLALSPKYLPICTFTWIKVKTSREMQDKLPASGSATPARVIVPTRAGQGTSPHQPPKQSFKSVHFRFLSAGHNQRVTSPLFSSFFFSLFPFWLSRKKRSGKPLMFRLVSLAVMPVPSPPSIPAQSKLAGCKGPNAQLCNAMLGLLWLLRGDFRIVYHDSIYI